MLELKIHMSQSESETSNSFFGRSPWLVFITVFLILALGAGFRLMRADNPPLDVHAWRWLRSAVTARGFYYEMDPNSDPAARQSAIQISEAFPYSEPPLTEGIVAISYLVAGGEQLWFSTLWTTVFWVIAGLALFLLARRITSIDGAVVALAYFMLLPFGNTESRAFLPEPLMVMFIFLALYASYRWVEGSSWKWAILTGLLAGMAILTKIFAVFPLAPAIFLICLASFGLRRSVKNPQAWLVLILSVLIPASYYFFPNIHAGSDYLSTWSLPFLRRLLDVTFYIGWLHMINTYFNLAIVLIGIASISLLEKRGRWLVLGLWIGYGLLGLAFPSLIWSHIYYDLPLVGIVSLSIAPLGMLLLSKIAKQGFFWQALFIAATLIAVGYSVFMSRKAIVANDFRNEPQKWEQLGSILSGRTIGLTEDYNMRLVYFGNKVITGYMQYYDWAMVEMSGKEIDENSANMEFFQSKVKDYDYFVVTLFKEFELQPYLKDILYDHYPVFKESDWYVVFDLRHPMESKP
jgi:hypothetical protein